MFTIPLTRNERNSFRLQSMTKVISKTKSSSKELKIVVQLKPKVK